MLPKWRAKQNQLELFGNVKFWIFVFANRSRLIWTRDLDNIQSSLETLWQLLSLNFDPAATERQPCIWAITYVCVAEMRQQQQKNSRRKCISTTNTSRPRKSELRSRSKWNPSNGNRSARRSTRYIQRRLDESYIFKLSLFSVPARKVLQCGKQPYTFIRYILSYLYKYWISQVEYKSDRPAVDYKLLLVYYLTRSSLTSSNIWYWHFLIEFRRHFRIEFLIEDPFACGYDIAFPLSKSSSRDSCLTAAGRVRREYNHARS